MVVYTCDSCNKKFASRQNLDYHIENNVCVKNDSLICEHCYGSYSSKSCLNRHMKTCKLKDVVIDDKDISDTDILEEFDKLDVKKDRQFKRVYELLKKMKEERDDLNIKVTLNNDGDTNITNNYNNSTVNNGTINNIYLVGYGKEDMSRIDKDELLKVFRKGFNSPLTLTETMHFNPKYPEFHNVYIKNMKEKYAMMYDGDSWNMVMREDLIDKIYDNKRDYIEENLEDFYDSLTNSQKKAMHRWMNIDESHNYIKKVKEDIKLMMYNKRDMAKNNDKCLTDTSNVPNVIVVSCEDDKNITVEKKSKKRVASRKGTKRKIVKARKR